jgi:hypothetical protein
LRADADVPRAWQKPERNQRGKKRKIECEMIDEAEIITGSAFRFNSCAFSAMLVSEPMPL